MELRNINTFLHIAELHSFSRTARQLGYSQSAVSSQIAQLEAELGAPLFDRVGKTVRLTGAGETFLGYARTLLATVEQAQAALQLPQQISGRLRIALADSVCSTFLPDLLQRYHAQFPQVELVLCTATDDGMLQMLTTNQVDLAYTLDHPLLQPTLVRAVDVPEPVCFIAPAGHPLAARDTVSLEELVQQEFLLTERGMSYRDALDQCLAAHGLQLQPYLELGSAALLCQMVERGMGLSFLPEYIVRAALAAGTLARLNVPDCRVEMHRQLFYHRDKWLTPPDEGIHCTGAGRHRPACHPHTSLRRASLCANQGSSFLTSTAPNRTWTTTLPWPSPPCRCRPILTPWPLATATASSEHPSTQKHPPGLLLFCRSHPAGVVVSVF